MVTQVTMLPPTTRCGAISVTVPEIEACTGAETKERVCPIFCPRLTCSPTATQGTQGAPMCCAIGMQTVLGAVIGSTGSAAVSRLPSPELCSG